MTSVDNHYPSGIVPSSSNSTSNSNSESFSEAEASANAQAHVNLTIPQNVTNTSITNNVTKNYDVDIFQNINSNGNNNIVQPYQSTNGHAHVKYSGSSSGNAKHISRLLAKSLSGGGIHVGGNSVNANNNLNINIVA
ncbi:MAG: hypothetical protein SFT81_05240 [Candidatus Caenarcaniphilales bacterium]|nr:hypothetical protein [Candidatus Caenarcaniphilales bacterium]